MTLSIIIPAYNEAATIATLLRSVAGVDFGDMDSEVIVVDDHSTDTTAAEVTAANVPVTLITLPKNSGKSAAIRAGLKVATGEYVVIQDADLEYEPKDIKTLLDHAIQNNLPAVYGSRRLGEKIGIAPGTKNRFYFGGVALTTLTNALFLSHITDEPTCYKLVQRDILLSMQLTEERFGFCPEVTAKLLRGKHSITELPIAYHPRSVAEGKKIKFKDALEATYILLKYRLLPKRLWK
ncbi:glycosyltransferase family 2 protein [Candidatus Kaiserbacteria bacterium]|nr:glycosyltransferase family 2 protein [Candidatus Kaiserbacteria bacterium]